MTNIINLVVNPSITVNSNLIRISDGTKHIAIIVLGEYTVLVEERFSHVIGSYHVFERICDNYFEGLTSETTRDGDEIITHLDRNTGCFLRKRKQHRKDNYTFALIFNEI